jgi:hypothetical protein
VPHKGFSVWKWCLASMHATSFTRKGAPALHTKPGRQTLPCPRSQQVILAKASRQVIHNAVTQRTAAHFNCEVRSTRGGMAEADGCGREVRRKLPTAEHLC